MLVHAGTSLEAKGTRGLGEIVSFGRTATCCRAYRDMRISISSCMCEHHLHECLQASKLLSEDLKVLVYISNAKFVSFDDDREFRACTLFWYRYVSRHLTLANGEMEPTC